MKSEERHELEANDLDKLLASWGKKVGPYANHMVFGLVAVVAAVAIWKVSTSAMGAKSAEGWDSYTLKMLSLEMSDDEVVEKTATKYAGRPLGDLAKINQADQNLLEGSDSFFRNKKDALESLNDAEKAYDELAKGASDKVIRERAVFGKARVLETKGDVEGAIAAYKEVTGIYKKVAEGRVERLEEVNAKDYAKWLATAQAAPPRDPIGRNAVPDFDTGPLDLRNDGADAPSALPGGAFSDILENLNKKLPDGSGSNADRYEEPAVGDDSTPAETDGSAEGTESSESTTTEESTP